MGKTALITGITGQDGAYLAELLLNKGYKVYGTFRRTSSLSFWRIEYLKIINHPQLFLIECDITDLSSCLYAINTTKPHEVYNLAAQSFVATSFIQPFATAQITGLGALNMLDAIRISGIKARFYQASSSELYGKVTETPQSELTAFYPRSPYAVAKLYAHALTINYREAYNIFAVCGILFNHESPLRGLEFVTRKITDAAAKIKLGKIKKLELGNLDAKRDWGYAKEYVEGMWLMMQTSTPETYVLATGKTISVRDFTQMAFLAAGIELIWEGSGINECGINKTTGEKIIFATEEYMRPSEVDLLLGNPSKAKKDLNWEAKTSIQELCQIMVDHDIQRNKKEN